MSSYVLVPGRLVGDWIRSGVGRPVRECGHRVEVVERLPSVGPGARGDLAGDADHRHRLPSSHLPMPSMPDALADLLDRAP